MSKEKRKGQKKAWWGKVCVCGGGGAEDVKVTDIHQ